MSGEDIERELARIDRQQAEIRELRERLLAAGRAAAGCEATSVETRIDIVGRYFTTACTVVTGLALVIVAIKLVLSW